MSRVNKIHMLLEIIAPEELFERATARSSSRSEAALQTTSTSAQSDLPEMQDTQAVRVWHVVRFDKFSTCLTRLFGSLQSRWRNVLQTRSVRC